MFIIVTSRGSILGNGTFGSVLISFCRHSLTLFCLLGQVLQIIFLISVVSTESVISRSAVQNEVVAFCLHASISAGEKIVPIHTMGVSKQCLKSPVCDIPVQWILDLRFCLLLIPRCVIYYYPLTPILFTHKRYNNYIVVYYYYMEVRNPK